MTDKFAICNMGLNGSFIKENGKIMDIERVVDLLNELSEANEQLKQVLREQLEENGNAYYIEILDKIFDVTCVSNGLTSCNVKENFWVVIWIFYIMIIIMYMTGTAMTVFEGKLVDLDVRSFI